MFDRRISSGQAMHCSCTGGVTGHENQAQALHLLLADVLLHRRVRDSGYSGGDLMSVEKMREEFEAWARDGFYSGLACAGDTWSDERGMYTDPAHHMAFCAWQASRAAIEVALPSHLDHTGCKHAIECCAEAIEAIGLKVKP